MRLLVPLLALFLAALISCQSTTSTFDVFKQL